MDYKQKYEQAIENIKKIKAANKDNKELVDFIEFEYPELKESEDADRVIKGKLREILRLCYEGRKCSICASDYITILVWLEKQGEQSFEEKVNEAMREVEEKAKAFTAKHKGETTEEILAQMRGEQKPAAWSDEDEDYYDAIIAKLELTQFDALLTDNQMEFLKSLKQRIKGE